MALGCDSEPQEPVVRSQDSAIHQINPYPVDKIYTNSMQWITLSRLRTTVPSKLRGSFNWANQEAVNLIFNDYHHMLYMHKYWIWYYCQPESETKVFDCVLIFLGLTICQQQRAQALQAGPGGLQPVGRFVPECDVTGNFLSVQCWGSVGYCWCVNPATGDEIGGTRVRGRPDCSVQSGKKLLMFMECCVEHSL